MELPRFYELSWKEAIFLGWKTVVVLFWCGVLRRFENVFGNNFLGDCVCIWMIYVVYELCLTLECDRIFIWPCTWELKHGRCA